MMKNRFLLVIVGFILLGFTSCLPDDSHGGGITKPGMKPSTTGWIEMDEIVGEDTTVISSPNELGFVVSFLTEEKKKMVGDYSYNGEHLGIDLGAEGNVLVEGDHTMTFQWNSSSPGSVEKEKKLNYGFEQDSLFFLEDADVEPAVKIRFKNTYREGTALKDFYFGNTGFEPAPGS